MQKHAERTDKRPPISEIQTTPTTNTTTNSNSGNRGNNNANNNLNLNNNPLPSVAETNSYWPKVSPDSAANLTDVMQQQQQTQNQLQAQQQQQQQQQAHEYGMGHPAQDLQAHHRLIESHRDDVGEDLVVSRHLAQQQQPPSSSATPGPYDTKSSTNSAFTPINSMAPHLNSIGHHPMAQRPYLYDAISFPNKNVNQNTNSFPNQLISLHQIRNYAHQPSGLMSGEHLLGVSVGAGKDKG